jgi:hypothetical protein
MIIRRWGGSQTTTRVGSTTNTNVLVQGISTDGLIVGTTVSGTGIPAGATVASIVGATSFNLSAAATATGTPTLTFSGLFFTEYPKTKAQLIRTQADDNNIFDSNDKIKVAYLPDAVFDSLYFYNTVSSGPNSLSGLADSALTNAASINRSALGYYWVSNGSSGVTAQATPVQIGSLWYRTELNPSDDGTYGSGITGSSLEAGDWLVITKITGAGTSGTPYVVTFGVVENTYELMTGANGSVAGTSGLVPAPAATDNVKYLTGAGTWGTPAGTYAHPTGGADSTIAAATGLVISAITVNNLGHVTSVGSKTLAAADIPTLNQNTTGTAANVTGVVALANGGTGATTAQTAINALAGSVTAGSYLRGNGSNILMSGIQAADVPTLNQNTTGTAANVTGTVAIANGGTGFTTKTNAFNALSPIDSLGDIIYGGALGSNTKLAGNTSATKQFLSQTGTGSASAAPAWGALAAGDIPTLNQNTTGTAANVTGTVAIANGGTGATTKAAGFDALSPLSAGGDLLTHNGTNNIRLAKGTAGQVLKINSGATAVEWGTDNNTTYTASALGGLSMTAEVFRMNHPLFIQTATPTTPVAGTVWFDIN